MVGRFSVLAACTARSTSRAEACAILASSETHRIHHGLPTRRSQIIVKSANQTNFKISHRLIEQSTAIKCTLERGKYQSIRNVCLFINIDIISFQFSSVPFIHISSFHSLAHLTSSTSIPFDFMSCHFISVEVENCNDDQNTAKWQQENKLNVLQTSSNTLFMPACNLPVVIGPPLRNRTTLRWPLWAAMIRDVAPKSSVLPWSFVGNTLNLHQTSDNFKVPFVRSNV